MKRLIWFHALWMTAVTIFFPGYAHALGVSPSLKELTLQPGESTSITVVVENTDDYNLRISLSLAEFKDGREPGVPELYRSNTSPISSWVIPGTREFILDPHEKREVSVRFRIPSDTKAGGYYIGLFVEGAPLNTAQDQNSSVLSKQAVVPLFFLTVKGDVKRIARISHFKAEGTPLLFFPAHFSFDMANIGNVHLQPRGQIRVNNLFSSRIHLIPLNPERVRILPNSSRNIVSQWRGDNAVWWSPINPFRFGVYEAELFFEDMELEGTLRTRFIILSPITMVAILGGVVTLIIYFYRKNRPRVA